MFADGALLRPALVDVADYVGRYAFYDDGWPGMLTLWRGQGRALDGAYHSYRFGTDHSLTAVVDERHGHHIGLTIHDFNELPGQSFTGYLFTRAYNGIAGSTEWKGEQFGFLARRWWPASLGVSHAGRVRSEDFAGKFSVYCDGEHATLELRVAGTRALSGTLREGARGRAFPVAAAVDERVAHKVTMTVHGLHDLVPEADPPVITAFLFSRPRSVMAGWLDWGGEQVGCYLERFE
jgi:hypothetical protein